DRVREDEDMGDACECACGKKGCASNRRVGRHGTTYRYTNGCRCDECRSANVEATIRRRKAKNEASLTTATNRYKEWTGPELEVIVRDDLTASEMARMLNRTIMSVKSMRHKCKTDPRKAKMAGVRL